MKIINAMPGIGSMSESEVEGFLESKLNVQLATIDEKGDPNIQPVWFYYDRPANKIFVATRKDTKKVKNVRKKPGIYFSVDDESFPYKGVKGKGTVRVSEDPKRNLPVAEKINLKYLGTLDHPIAKMILESTKNGTEVLLEITPRFFSTWDFSKM